MEGFPDYSHEIAEEPLRALADEFGVKAGLVFGQLRWAVSGQQVSPPLLESMQIMGREKVLNRVKQAVVLLKGLAAQEVNRIIFC